PAVPAFPFPRMARVLPNDTELLPTAQTGLFAGAATPNRKLSPAPTLGLGTIDQWAPFQRSVSVRRCPGSFRYPTAQMSVLLLAEAPRRAFSPAPLLGLGMTDHFTPSPCSSSVRKLGVVFS